VVRDTIINNSGANESEIKIQKTDILSVTVSSMNPGEDLVFNAPGDSKTTTGGYQVNQEGNIYLHKLGSLPVLGLTRREVKSKLEKELQAYFKDPVVSVNFVNHKVTLLGELAASKVIDMPTERISIFEALASGGGTSANAKLNSVVVIRENAISKEIKHINLEDQSIFNSQWYYLQPNDVVMLTPDKDKINKEEKQLKLQQTTGFVLQSLSIAILLYNVFVKK
jgi:polysaccharide export outer membrane protein